MSDDASALPWTPQQWATLRGVIQEAARKSRVASTFLPIEGPVGRDQSTVPANRIHLETANNRLTTDSGQTLHLTTIACQVHLRSADVADPNLEVAKSLVRRAAEVLGRLEDHIIFNGLDSDPANDPKVAPKIFTISGGRGHLGLLDAPHKLWALEKTAERVEAVKTLAANMKNLNEFRKKERKKEIDPDSDEALKAQQAFENAKTESPVMLTEVRTPSPSTPDDPTIVPAVIDGVQSLERRGHFGPFAVVLGNNLYRHATAPFGIEALAPVLRIVPFLGGGDVHRSSTIPPDDGIIVALGGQPIELVLACDMDLKFLQVSLEPRHVFRVYERFVLRIKELDAVFRITSRPGSIEGFVAKP